MFDNWRNDRCYNKCPLKDVSVREVPHDLSGHAMQATVVCPAFEDGGAAYTNTFTKKSMEPAVAAKRAREAAARFFASTLCPSCVYAEEGARTPEAVVAHKSKPARRIQKCTSPTGRIQRGVCD